MDTRSDGWMASPYLHLFDHAVLNPHTGRGMGADHQWYKELRQLILNETRVEKLSPIHRALLADDWLIPVDCDLSHRYRLRYLALEAHSVCSQRCFFCPVSVAPREPYFMQTELYERILREVAELGEPVEAVVMVQYNEATLDRRFIQQVRYIKELGLPVAVLSNGSNLTPKTVDSLVELGGLDYFSCNLSTLDRERYARERGRDHLEMVLKNLDYAKNRAMAREMVIVVLGTDAEDHALQYAAIRNYFEGSRFKVQDFEANDRAGYLEVGLKAQGDKLAVRGCDYMGSRPIEHLHITASAKAVICCQDYDESWVLGDLKTQSVREILQGEAFARARRIIYGIDPPPENFICTNCPYALKR